MEKCWRIVKKKEKALKDFEKVLKLNPNNVDAHYNRGVVLYDLRRKEEALESYDKSLELNPDDEDALVNKTNLLEELGLEGRRRSS